MAATGVRALLRRFLVWRVGVALVPRRAVRFPPRSTLAGIAACTALLGGPSPGFSLISLHAVSCRPDEPRGRRCHCSSCSTWPPTARRSVARLRAPALQARHGALVASLVIGAVWAFWHLPKLLTEGGPGYSDLAVPARNDRLAVLFTWVFNGTAGEPAHRRPAPFVGEHVNGVPAYRADRGDGPPRCILRRLFCLAAVAVIVLTRGRLLSRRPGRPVPLFWWHRTVVPAGQARATGLSRRRPNRRGTPHSSIEARGGRRRTGPGCEGATPGPVPHPDRALVSDRYTVERSPDGARVNGVHHRVRGR